MRENFPKRMGHSWWWPSFAFCHATVIQCSTLCTQRKVTKFPCFWCLVFGAQFQHFLEFFLPIFCYAVSSCVYDHSHPNLVSECLFPAENKAFPYPRRVRAHPRRVRAILWDAAATCSVVIFVAVATKKRSPNLSVSWLTLYGLVDWLPVLAGNFRRALQRHFLVDFQTEDIAGKIFSCSKRACFVFVNRARNGWTAFARSLPTHRFHDWLKTEAALQRQRHCSVICQSIFKTKLSLERSFPVLNEHVLLLWIKRETAEERPLEVCRRIDFAIDRRLRPLASEALQRHFSIDFQNQNIIEQIFSCSKRACFAFVNRTRNGWTASARSLPTHRFCDWLNTEAALKFNLLTGYPKYERHALHSRHWLGESMKRSAEVENVFFIFIFNVVKARKISSFACVV